MDYKIESMKESDWKQVSEIYMDGIKTEIATFQSEAPTWEEWDKGHVANCRFVARVEEYILGWVAMSPVSSRCVYAGVAEVSVYVHKDYKGMGVGTALLNYVIEESEKLGFWTLQSGIIKENKSSRLLHLKCGFREIGYRERVGKMKNGTWHDVVLMERRSKKIENE